MCLSKKRKSKQEYVTRGSFADHISELDTKSSILALTDSAIAFEGY